MTTAQHLAPHAAAHPGSAGADVSAGIRRTLSAFRARIVRARKSFHAGDALAAAGYTVMSAYAAGLVVYVATVY